MSRIGKKPLQIPKGVHVAIESGELIRVKGSKGELSRRSVPEVSFDLSRQGIVSVLRKDDSKRARSMHGLYRKLLENMIRGVSQGFEKVLMINGVGYRAEPKGKNVQFNLGYSTLIEFEVPEGIDIKIDGNTKVTVSGIDKVRVGQIASEIRSLRPPEPYKGKGVMYENERIIRKEGKGKAGGGS